MKTIAPGVHMIGQYGRLCRQEVRFYDNGLGNGMVDDESIALGPYTAMHYPPAFCLEAGHYRVYEHSPTGVGEFTFVIDASGFQLKGAKPIKPNRKDVDLLTAEMLADGLETWAHMSLTEADKINLHLMRLARAMRVLQGEACPNCGLVHTIADYRVTSDHYRATFELEVHRLDPAILRQRLVALLKFKGERKKADYKNADEVHFAITRLDKVLRFFAR